MNTRPDQPEPGSTAAAPAEPLRGETVSTASAFATSCASSPDGTGSTSGAAVAAHGWASGRARTRLRTVLAVVAVVMIAAGIRWLWPARHPSLVMHSGTATSVVTVTIDGRVGTDDIGIDVADRAGEPLRHAMIRVRANDPRMGFAGEPVIAAETAPGRYSAANVSFMTAGPWQLLVSITIATGAAPENLSLPLWITG